MLLGVRNLSLAFGPKTLFREAAFSLAPRARTGLVGPNGSGKTTLLRILMGLAEADAGTIEKPGGVSLGYLPQEGIVLGRRSILEEVESAASDIQAIKAQLADTEHLLASLDSGSPDYAECLERFSHLTTRLQDLEAHKLGARAESILLGLGFRMDQLARSCSTFSGGWQMRVALARLLLEEPDLLLLDEPTNHLDLDSLRWLETFLEGYPGGILLISHDRTLLDRLCRSILSLESGRVVSYAGNYSAFMEERAQRLEQLEAARKSQDRKIAQTERFIERFRYKATKARQVQSRIKALQKIDRLDTEAADKTIHFAFPVSRASGHVVATVDSIRKAYGDNRVFDGFSLRIERGDRIGVVGLNGAGKSTLARILAGREAPDQGTVQTGYQVDLGYFAQDQSDELNPGQSVFAAASAPPVRGTDLHIRSVLGAFLFSGDDLEKPVAVLSGGEKNRLALARLLLCPANFLILDEPTNHLDMASKEILQEALLAFPGTTFVVSHDRHFLNPVVNKILEIQPGHGRLLPGSLDDYIWKVDQERAARPEKAPDGRPEPASAENPRERRRRQARRQAEQAPLKRRMQELENGITQLEQQISQREQAMADKAFFERGAETARELHEYENWKPELAALLEEWDRTARRLEEMESGEAK